MAHAWCTGTASLSQYRPILRCQGWCSDCRGIGRAILMCSTAALRRGNLPRLAAVRPSEATSQRHHGEIEADVEVDIPIYDERLSATARDPLAGSVERKGARTTGTNMLAVIARIDVNTASSHHVTSVGASMKGRHLYQRGGLRKGSGVAICASSRCNRLCKVRKIAS